MKRMYYIVMLLGLLSCNPVAITPSITSTVIIEIATETPIVSHVTPTETPIVPQVTPTADSLIRRDYDPTEWQQLYDKDMVWKIEIDPSQQIWIYLDSGEVGYFDGDNWMLFSGEDYGFLDKPSDMAIAPDGSVWISGRQTISHYLNGSWQAYSIPNVSETAITRLAVSPTGEVWVATPRCNCEDTLKKFDGTEWEEIAITDQHYETWQIIFTADGTLWAALDLPTGIGKFDGTSWMIFAGEDLWPTDIFTGNRIASDSMGNIYAIQEYQEWIVRISPTGEITRIPYEYPILGLMEQRLRIFIDSQDTIWINASYNDRQYWDLAYYQDNQWVYFANTPFNGVMDIDEMADGTILVSTGKGLFQLRSEVQEP